MGPDSSDIGSLSLQTLEKNRARALLVSVYKGGSSQKELAEEHLRELSLLANTYGITVVNQQICPIRQYDAATYVTMGKLQELQNAAKQHQANLIVFDDEISPSQQRNLEKAFGCPVIDRTEVILEVFAQRARTKEARLQIELAKVKYQAPRLKRLWTHLSRQHGSGGSGSAGGHTKGEGEKQIEIDRRILKRKIDALQSEIDEVRAHRETQRSSRERSDIFCFGIIGYTNAGKSTLLNALTGAEVFVEDKLFATLDTTTRKFILTNHQEVLLTDTVGFIRKLPHLLVAAFKSTLEEAFASDILLHLIDVSHPMALEQADTTYEVLKELNVENKPIITVFNKIDLVTDQSVLQQLLSKYPGAVQISAAKQIGFDKLLKAMTDEMSKKRKVISLRIPQSEYHIFSEIKRHGSIISQEYEENDIVVTVELPAAVGKRFHKYTICD